MTTAQQPLGSGFDHASTAADVIKGIDLTGKTAIVTGGSGGIGLETVRVLRDAGADVVAPTRKELDLVEPASVEAFAESFLTEGRPLHLLINNAGVMATPLTRDVRGNEWQFAVNHLGHFRLTARLWPALAAADGARVVALSSRGHRFSPVVFEDLSFERRTYEPFPAYGQSKTANSLFAVELDRRGREEGIRAFAVHPGAILDTALIRHLSEDALRAAGVEEIDGRRVLNAGRQVKTIAQGAATTVWCATSPALDGLGGVYCEDCDISPLIATEELAASDGLLSLPGVLAYAVDPDIAARLWEVSDQLM